MKAPSRRPPMTQAMRPGALPLDSWIWNALTQGKKPLLVVEGFEGPSVVDAAISRGAKVQKWKGEAPAIAPPGVSIVVDTDKLNATTAKQWADLINLRGMAIGDDHPGGARVLFLHRCKDPSQGMDAVRANHLSILDRCETRVTIMPPSAVVPGSVPEVEATNKPALNEALKARQVARQSPGVTIPASTATVGRKVAV
jgi:hypothetical protein